MSKYGKIFVIVGRSGSGKDTIYKRLLEELDFLVPVVQYTTRPMRDGEINGKEYNFIDDDEFNELELRMKMIESRTYHPNINNKKVTWKYGNSIDSFNKEAMYLMISTPEGLETMREYIDEEFSNSIVPIFIDVDEKTILERTIDRESKLSNPNYIELCDRFVRDAPQFELRIIKSIFNNFKNKGYIVENYNLTECINKIKDIILLEFVNNAEDYKYIYRIDDILSYISIHNISTRKAVDKLLNLYKSVDRLISIDDINEDVINNIKRGDVIFINLKDDTSLVLNMYRVLCVDFVDRKNKSIYPSNERGTRYAFDIFKDCIAVGKKLVCNKKTYEGITL